MLCIKNAIVVDPANKIGKNMETKKDILIDGGKLLKISEKIDCVTDSICEVIDAEGCIVAPGLVDVHVHFRDPGFTYKEDIETGAKAAL